jgi:hypothetical protein
MPAVVEQIDAWRIRNRVFLEGARYVLAPSLDTASRMLASFPSAQVRYAPHTDISPAQLAPPNPKARPQQRPLRIVVIGALSIIKGAEVLEATALQAHQAGAPLEFHLIGFGYRHLRTKGSTLTVHGEYDEADLPAMLQRLAPDVAWFPALWPETYSYTLSAVLAAELPVVVSDLGALPERIASRPWSWVQNWSSTPEQWVTLFSDISRQLLNSESTVTPSAPALAAPLLALQQRQKPWDYSRDYVPAQPNASPQEASHRAQTIASFFVEAETFAAPTQPPGGRLYRAALRLQRTRILAPVVRVVPSSWRHRIKRLLSH